eukprot:GHUV01001111.1.p1 GENE.GHUV01001111.1~~GHUV01001111.1.p1  ORF type:complete len:209 (+),score=77.89 GHUV01001111.1:164-790(+)
MAATFSAQRAFSSGVAQKQAAPSRSRSVRVCCAKQDAQKGALLAFGVAALINVAPANAGVIIEQPKIKKVLQDDAPAVQAPKREIILPGQRKQGASAPAAAAVKAAPSPKVQETSGGDLDPRAVALPGTIALIAGGAFALSKLDDGFADFMEESSCKDSRDLGAGYETQVKEGGALAVKSKSRAGTKKVKAATKSGGGSPLGTLFNRN